MELCNNQAVTSPEVKSQKSWTFSLSKKRVVCTQGCKTLDLEEEKITKLIKQSRENWAKLQGTMAEKGAPEEFLYMQVGAFTEQQVWPRRPFFFMSVGSWMNSDQHYYDQAL
jgi:hypothetical protein